MSGNIAQPEISAASGLVCPSLYSNIMMLRFIDPNKLCIVKGPNTVACICLKNFFVPVDCYNDTIAVLQPGEIRRVDSGMVTDYGIRREIYQYDVSSYFIGTPTISTNCSLSVSCISLGISETVSFVSGTTFANLITNIKAAINANANIKTQIEIYNIVESSQTFQIRAVTPGIAFTYSLSIDASIITNVLTQTPIRYPNGRFRFVLVEPLYVENVNPPLASNDKHIKYAYDDDYQTNGANATFRNLSKLYLNTADDDVNETDMNLIETVWIKNTHSKALQVQILVAS
ncbi:MAG: hypothetical protein WC979_00850 [Candidatus Pacearchaeota archaeon]|jgi:hypothetical protein|nr:hypothetical protein [Clostridia bacterium]